MTDTSEILPERALFDAYPRMRETLPIVPLATLPTPIEPFPVLPEAWVKRDDLTAEPYGGNKVRKLEFMLGRARADGVKTIMTYGAAGSNHALATAWYGGQLGFHCISMLVPQPNARAVRQNLLLHYATGAEMHCYKGIRQAALGTVCQFNKHFLTDGQFPRVIPPGGSAPLGIVGYVNAAFELRQQVEAGAAPKPDVIYVASGTMGTSLGLALGFAAMDWPVRIEAVRVTVARYTSLERARRLFNSTNRLLREADPSFPTCALRDERYRLRDDYFGGEYGRFTPEGRAAVRRAAEAGLSLEGTYTGKTLAALLGDQDAGRLEGQRPLFWNTYNSHDLGSRTEAIAPERLPEGFRVYFESPCQDE